MQHSSRLQTLAGQNWICHIRKNRTSIAKVQKQKSVKMEWKGLRRGECWRTVTGLLNTTWSAL
ncbi:rCG28892 [Rattus norvegicus]|uniref:RCG28892 n=1 Tax=Rattus norvegicus TaxID=10116 RepID=A6HW04_RAT|nr:rCG28892 [Rattus norvegicus]